MLRDYEGPDRWQAEFLRGVGEEVRRNRFDGMNAVKPLRRAVSSGHGIGKSTLAAWLVGWIMSTRPYSQGTVTANTFTQLETKTWAAVKKWTKMCLTSHWFEVGDNKMYHKEHKATWFCAPASCKEENSEAFAGQHQPDSHTRSLHQPGGNPRFTPDISDGHRMGLGANHESDSFSCQPLPGARASGTTAGHAHARSRAFRGI